MTTEWAPEPPPAFALRRWSVSDLAEYGFAHVEARALASRLPLTYSRDLFLNTRRGQGPYTRLTPSAAVLGVISTRLLERDVVQRRADSGRDVLALVAIIGAFAYCPDHPRPNTGHDPHVLERLPLLYAWVEDRRLTDRQVTAFLFAGIKREEVDVHVDPQDMPTIGEAEFLAAMRHPDFAVWMHRCFYDAASDPNRWIHPLVRKYS